MAIIRADNKWHVDIQPGGRSGHRVRKTFVDRACAVAFVRDILANKERTDLGIDTSLKICDLIDEFTRAYASIRFRGFEDEKYRLQVIRRYFEQSNKPIHLFHLSDGEAFVVSRIREGKKIGTVNRDINTLKRIFSWAVEREYLAFSPLAKLKHFRGDNRRIRWLTSLECEKLLGASKIVGQELYEVVFVALNTGFRLSNIEELTWNDVGPEFISARRTKSGMPYEVPISPSLSDLLSQKSIREGKVLKTSNLRKSFEIAVKLAGFSTHPDDPNKVTFHTLRHTFASYWLQKGTSIYTVSKWLGHSSVQMTERVYGHLSRTHHLDEMRKFSGIGCHSVDTLIIPFPENASERSGPNGIRTRDLCLEREE